MGNKNSATSKARSGQRAKVASIEPQPHHVFSRQRKYTRMPEVVSVRAYPTENEGKTPLCDDHTFSNYIQRTKYKISSNSNIGCHDEQRCPAYEDDMANVTNNNMENERDPFSDYIQNARKKEHKGATLLTDSIIQKSLRYTDSD
ncbi:unnamed protein product [Sphenostylis stenocarpa]|uniref:Uncharacterized protein n=1 Tax=Sphenostylis stenocarpa TaxID=92480 RepID=A0AA86SR98_9FABA|nr:unnamed protein product [Sphenostylis stenocarpa]